MNNSRGKCYGFVLRKSVRTRPQILFEVPCAGVSTITYYLQKYHCYLTFVPLDYL